MTLFSNYNQVANNPMRADLLGLADKGIKSVLPKNIMREQIKCLNETLTIQNHVYKLNSKRIFVVGAGKASANMAIEFENIIGPDNIVDGVVISNIKDKKTKKIKLLQGKHPYPDATSFNNTKSIINLAHKYQIGVNDIVVGLFSGGASSMMTLPLANLDLKNLLIFFKILINSGMNVHEMTSLKKSVSSVKGGKLAKHFYPAQIISLIISDVIDNDISVIGSGPFYIDKKLQMNPTTILDKYELNDKIPNSIKNVLYNNRNFQSELRKN